MRKQDDDETRIDRRYVEVRPSSSWRAIDVIEIWRYRGLAIALARRDITLRYRQTALGVIWVVLQPLLAAGIFSFVFGRVAKLPSDGIPYLVFSYTGLLAWNAFSSTLERASGCLLGPGSSLISKIYFPRLILPISTFGATLLDFSVAASVMIVLLVQSGVGLHLSLLTVPLWLVLVLALALGPGLFFGGLVVRYRDVAYVVPVAIQLLLYMSPVAYSISNVPDTVRPFYALNPMVGAIEGMRWAALSHGHIGFGNIVYSCAAALVMLVAGTVFFRRMERSFADVV